MHQKIGEKAVTIRPLRQEDAAFLCSIFKENAEYYEIFFDSGNTLPEWENRVKNFLSQDEVYHFIIEANCTNIGWVSFLNIEAAERELCILVINKDNLRHGFGAQTLSWLIKKSKEDNIRYILLNVNQNNTRAIQFYQRFGFEIFEEEIVSECNDAVNLAQYKMRLSLI